MARCFSNGVYQEPKSTYIASMEEALALCGNLPDNCFEIQSDWVLAEYKDFLEGGKYPYLSEVQKFIVARNGLPEDYSERESGNRGCDLSTLIYNAAARYRRERDKAEGWMYAAPDLCEQNMGKKIELRKEGLFGNSIIVGVVVKGSRGYFLKPPRARTRGFLLSCESQIREQKKEG